ncbi:MAG: hypothetical protein M1825_001018 [Sarcosagium campestre]|nr:MAG: hypothetical protein M1825_001018 [Sarcosagium campestre]
MSSTTTPFNDRLSSLVAEYNERSASYDHSFHPLQATDFVERASFLKGHNVLDVACGTGLVTLQAKFRVGDGGTVVGVDAAEKMLDVARRKAQETELDVRFVPGDALNLDRAAVLPKGLSGFDVVTCATAWNLMDDPFQALVHWASFLASRGRIIADLPIESFQLCGNIIREIFEEQREVWNLSRHRDWVSGADSIKKLIYSTGLQVEALYETESYGSGQIKTELASEMFENYLKFAPLRTLDNPKLQQRFKELCVERFHEIYGPQSTLREDLRFYIVIARKCP